MENNETNKFNDNIDKDLESESVDAESKYRNSLFTVHDGTPEKMTIEDLFNHDNYDVFEGVTYSASGSFINKYLTKFSKIRLITGAGDSTMNSKVYNAMQAPTQNIHLIQSLTSIELKPIII